METETETEALVAAPFSNLDDLYSKVDHLKPWHTKDIRESTEYVYSGNQAFAQNGKLRRLERDEQPKTIVCHDMKGGYLEDRFINGSTAHDSYVFYHWNVIDTFVYFSHKFVTIPPYGWINAAHTHGVKVLGTIITERTDGERIWDRVLSSRSEIRHFADALIRLAAIYGFDGWLLNVENKIKSTDVEELIYFVKYLTENIHKEIEGAEIIWYDSVTYEGELNWQNELNSHNKAFFKNCDGIFLNYNWSDSSLSRSREVGRLDGRARDIYVGLDVWGRGCPGGGGFNSAHALERIRKQDLSVAIFAPGWTHEYFGPDTFHKIECIFWAQLIPHLYIHAPIYDKENFVTSFCRGTGINHYRYGQLEPKTSTRDKKSTATSFYDLSVQNIQTLAPGLHSKFTHIDIPPLIETTNHPTNDKTTPIKVQPECTFETALEILRVNGKKISFIEKNTNSTLNYVDYCQEYSYNGGGCLKLITKDVKLSHRLFLVHIEYCRDVQASLVYKENESLVDGTDTLIEGPELILGNENESQRIRSFNTVQLNFGWKKKVYSTNLRTITEIGVICSRTGSCYLGELVIERQQRRFGNDKVYVENKRRVCIHFKGTRIPST